MCNMRNAARAASQRDDARPVEPRIASHEFIHRADWLERSPQIFRPVHA